MIIAEIIVYSAFVYLSIGFLFAIYFVFFGVQKYDEASKDSGIGFRLIIFFGVAAFWILFAQRILKGNRRPVEDTAHRKAARGKLE